MEDLIKGIVDVAIGHNDRRNNNNNNNNNDDGDSDSIDERSRSTWAQVVSGEQDTDQSDHQAAAAAAAAQSQTHYSGYNNEQQDNDDGWQTAHKKHHKRPQRIHMDHWGSYKSHPDEQQYSEDVQYADDEIEPSEAELYDYKRACAKLWQLDFNRLTPGKDYEVDVGEGKRVHDKEDMTEDSLFTWVSEDVLRRPTFSRFFALLDNYNPYEGYKENVTDEERREQAAFIEEISRTAPIKYLHKYLSSTGILNENYQEFKRMLTDLWFTLYSRGGTSGNSSSFEHVFVGEIKECGEQQVSGFHNWLQFYLEESKGTADYQGYILPRRNEQFPDAETQLLTVQFEWNGVLKSLSSMFVGVSPEFELALYTLCFFAGEVDNHIQVGPYPVNIKCYPLGNKIGSAFPIAEA